MSGEVKFYRTLILRRMPAMLFLLLLCSALGIAAAVRLPTVYSASARLIIEAPQIPNNLASTTVQVAPSQEIELIRQQLMTRANLLEIENKFDVLKDAGTKFPDQIITYMRDNTFIQASGAPGGRRGGQQPTLLTVSFDARSGQIAADVVNEYVTRLISANVSLRTGAAGDTLSFFEQEVERLGTELELRSAKISEFQSANSDALPGNLAFYQNRLSLLQERVASNQRQRVALVERRQRILELFQNTGQIDPNRPRPLSPNEQQLQSLRSQLTQALSVFSESNPTVVLLRSQIEKLESEIENLSEEQTGSGITAVTLLDIQIADIDSQIESIDDVIKQAEAEIAGLTDQIARTPQNTITLQAMQRDYDNIQRQYDNAVASLSQASMGERIEVTARGQRITLIESVAVPTEPSRPNRKMIAAGGVGAGFALAAGLFFLLELLNRSVRRPAEITKRLGITPLATIPFLESRGRRVFGALVRSVLFLAVLVGLPAALWAVDTYYLPLELVAERVLVRLGLS
jgi:polysaccharide chain length determinant protein (PEP-CTERM system associated)